MLKCSQQYQVAHCESHRDHVCDPGNRSDCHSSDEKSRIRFTSGIPGESLRVLRKCRMDRYLHSQASHPDPPHRQLHPLSQHQEQPKHLQCVHFHYHSPSSLYPLATSCDIFPQCCFPVAGSKLPHYQRSHSLCLYCIGRWKHSVFPGNQQPGGL